MFLINGIKRNREYSLKQMDWRSTLTICLVRVEKGDEGREMRDFKKENFFFGCLVGWKMGIKGKCISMEPTTFYKMLVLKDNMRENTSWICLPTLERKQEGKVWLRE